MRLSALAILMSSAALVAQFKPEISEIDVGSRRLRPGDSTFMTVKFVNKGTAPAPGDYMVFVHVESADKKCDDIRGHHDHEPIDNPTSLWKPGETVTDGPFTISTNSMTKPGRYLIHVGVYDMATGIRYLDSYAAGELTVDPEAPTVVNVAPAPLSVAEAAVRKAALDARADGAPHVVETPSFRFRLSADGRAYDLLDKLGGALWHSNPSGDAFGYVGYHDGNKPCRVAMLPADRIVKDAEKNTLRLEKNVCDGLQVAIVIAPVSVPDGLRFSVERTGRLADTCSVQVLCNAFPVSNNDSGASVVGYRTGERFDTMRSLRPVRRSWGVTYSWDSTMAMIGQEKEGCALLVNWTHPHTAYDFMAKWTYAETMPGTVVQTMNVRLNPGATECFVRPLGKGSYVEIAKAYREVAYQQGLVKTWKMKEAATGGAVRNMAGAADFKPFVFSRCVPTSRYNHSGKVETHVGYTLEEVSQIAEHLHGDLDIDRAMMVLAGWVHGGYDNQHPDPLPVAPELGGNDELVKASKRIRDTGFLFGLHDNYQDMYEDAPSWNPDFVAKNSNGSKVQGGNWAGGPCWIVCAEKQVELASREETNLPQIEKLFHPTIYFIDTIFAAGLYECHDPNHPGTRADDMKWKTKLCQLARKHFGLFGSEEGREWAVPYADYMEGLFGHRVNIKNLKSDFHSHLGGDLVPLFEMVYGDCTNLYTHQSDRAAPGRDDYILACVANAEVPLYQFGNHLYYENSNQSGTVLSFEKPVVTALGDRKFKVTYVWHLLKDCEKPLNMFVHFVHQDSKSGNGDIAFQDDHSLVTSGMKAGEVIRDERIVEIPKEYGSDIEWRIGVFNVGIGRQQVTSANGIVDTSHTLGILGVDDALNVTYSPKGSGVRSDLSRSDNGWGDEHRLNRTDTFIKNTYEVTSWIARLSADQPMTDHRFLNDERDAEYTAFDAMHIWTNQNAKPFTVDDAEVCAAFGGPVTLCQNGFVAVSRTFAAIHATAIGGKAFTNPVLFTFHAQDGKPLADSQFLRVFHGFGESAISLYGRAMDVKSEAVIGQ